LKRSIYNRKLIGQNFPKRDRKERKIQQKKKKADFWFLTKKIRIRRQVKNIKMKFIRKEFIIKLNFNKYLEAEQRTTL